ncbi:hypothetical protein DM860_003961 [Cuscuta australis]|uniref:Uncharacterized protein n=1 Tax=Cuscuta australis TaxID=267555 RepID=A0A328CYC5_9ASTE|nr:hypothetical protein DM860_003961 [Cuscuta australis]
MTVPSKVVAGILARNRSIVPLLRRRDSEIGQRIHPTDLVVDRRGFLSRFIYPNQTLTCRVGSRISAAHFPQGRRLTPRNFLTPPETPEGPRTSFPLPPFCLGGTGSSGLFLRFRATPPSAAESEIQMRGGGEV